MTSSVSGQPRSNSLTAKSFAQPKTRTTPDPEALRRLMEPILNDERQRVTAGRSKLQLRAPRVGHVAEMGTSHLTGARRVRRVADPRAAGSSGTLGTE